MIPDIIINKLRNVIGNNKADESVYDTFVTADTAIRNSEIILETNPIISEEKNQLMLKSLFGGLYFRRNKAGQICFSFGKKFLDTYNERSSIHLTMLIHEFKHYYDYSFNKNTFFQSNEKERFFLEIEARQIEVKFIKHYLENKFTLSDYENYLLESAERDNLESLTISVNRESSDVCRFLDTLEINYKTQKISKEQVIQSLIEKIDKYLDKQNTLMTLLDVYNTNLDDKYNRYGNYIRIKTFSRYTKYLLSAIAQTEIERRELIEKYPEIQDRFNRISLIINTYSHPNELYAESLHYTFEMEFDGNE